MERFNPFGADTNVPDELSPFSSLSPKRSSETIGGRQSASRTDSLGGGARSQQSSGTRPPAATSTTPLSPQLARYTTTFPDPFGESPDAANERKSALVGSKSSNSQTRSSSVTFANSLEELATTTAATAAQQADQSAVDNRSSRGQSSGLSSFLSRATSVTSSSVTDRVSGAVGSMRSAVDSLSSQIQQAVPANINERLSSTATNLIGGQSDNKNNATQQDNQQSAASYLAAKLSSATNQFTSSSTSANQSGSLAVISRQRIVLILDSVSSNIDWPQQFVNYRRLIAGLNPVGSSSNQSALSNFISSATAQLTSSSSTASLLGDDLVEQADFRDISVLANQSSSTAIVLVNSSLTVGSSKQLRGGTATAVSGARIIRPEYVVVRQRCNNSISSSKGDASSSADHLRGIVKAFNYCLVPMFEPLEVWNTFQDKQLVFARLLRIQKALGKENFPLIPQVFCQTHQDLLNHINSSTVSLPCLIKTGQLGKGRMKADNIQMLKDFASIVAISGLSCTVEPHLNVKCDLIIQKLGTSLKLFKRNNTTSSIDGLGPDDMINSKQSASRQTSLGSSVLSNLISNSSQYNQQQQQQQQNVQNRRSSNPGLAYDKLTEMVSVRYRNWIDAVIQEFDNKLECFCLKIVVTNEDREYIVGLSDCSMDFLGPLDNQEEDRRSFVELIISNMNTLLPKHSPISREPSANMTPFSGSGGGFSPSQFGSSQPMFRRSSSDDKPTMGAQSLPGSTIKGAQEHNSNLVLADKKRFISQTQINGANKAGGSAGGGRSTNTVRGYGQLSSRSQSVSVNQSDYMDADQPIGKSSYFTHRRGSDRSDSLANDITDDDVSGRTGDSSVTESTSGLANHQRQSSLGQSFLDQTSTAFSSFHKQSLSFFKRLDATGRIGGELSNTPPMSAKSDKNFDRSFGSAAKASVDSQLGVARRNDFKSQSVDCSGLTSDQKGTASNRSSVRGRRETPPKPPPPLSLGSRQSSLAAYSSQRGPPSSNTPNSTPNQTRQNTIQSGPTPDTDTTSGGLQRTRIVRQNSALSAFEPFDADLRINSHQRQSEENATRKDSIESSLARSSGDINSGRLVGTSGLDSRNNNSKLVESAKKPVGQYDSASITSGDSNSTNETTTAEDTMNNLKKTFASIFGDKCD